MPRTPKKTEEEIKEEMDLGEREEDVYTEEGSENLEEDDEISPYEEAFMKGWEEGKGAVECANCKKVLRKDYIEKEINGKIYRFCSEECVLEFEEKK